MLRRAGSFLLLAATGLSAGVLVARLPPDLDTAVVTRRHHGGDPLLTTALLRFEVDSLLRAPARYFHPPILFPDPNPLRGTEPLLAEALVAAPFRLALGVRPALVYTCVKLTTLALLALATSLLLRELGVRLILGLVAGGLSVMVATTTVFVDRLQAVSLQWIPLALLFAFRFWRSGRRSDAALVGIAAFLTVQASLYTSVMLLGAAPFLAPALGPILRSPQARRRLPALAAALLFAAVASLLVLHGYLADRADVAAYATSDYAAEKPWNPASLGDVLTSPPEYPPRPWRLAPAESWDGLYPGSAFVLFMAAPFGLPRGGDRRERPRRATRLLLAGTLSAFAGALGFGITAGAGSAARIVADAALWAAVLIWCGRLLLWPVPADDAERLRLVASVSALGALVLLLLSLGSPIRFQYFGEPLARGVFGPLSSLLTPLREMRELKRYLLPAGWAAIVAGAAALELRLRQLPRPIGPVLAAIVLAIGIAERADADTRKASLPPPPPGYELLRRSTRQGGLLELPFDEWGRIASIHRMLWQPWHGRPIVAGRTGLDPGWYAPALSVFNDFPSEESLLLLRAWGIDSVLDTRGGPEPAWPAGVELRGRFADPSGDWRLLDVLPVGDEGSALAEPSPPVGAWKTPSPPRSHDVRPAPLAIDGSDDSAAEVEDADGVAVAVPGGSLASAVEIDYGHGRFGRVPAELRVLGRVAGGQWRDLTDPPSARHLRARVANQLLRRRAARVVVLLRPEEANELRLVSTDVPWDLPELRILLARGANEPPLRPESPR